MVRGISIGRGQIAAIIVVGIAPGLSHAGPHVHKGDIVVGRTPEGQLAVEVPAEEFHELPPVSFSLMGWANNEPGFMTLKADEPKEDYYTLEQGAVIHLELVSIDRALKVWNVGFSSVLAEPGQSFILGASEFDFHPTYHIDLSDPAFDPERELYSATFRILDSGETGYTASEAFTLSFSPVPEPATFLLLALGAWGSAVRSRRLVGKRRGGAA